MGVNVLRMGRRAMHVAIAALVMVGAGVRSAGAQEAATEVAHRPGGEATLVLPDLGQVNFLGGIDGHTLLLAGIVVSVLGLLFGLTIYRQLERLPVHAAMLSPSGLLK